jgi:predicted helicase
MNRADRFIVNCLSFEEFRQRMAALSDKDKGDILERLTQVYLQTTPEYRTALEKVWLLGKAPATVLKAIGLERDDKGIDLIARHTNGTYWVIQAKYRSDEDKALGWRDLSTFFGLSSAPRRNISLGIVVHTTARPISNRALMGDKVVEIGLLTGEAIRWCARYSINLLLSGGPAVTIRRLSTLLRSPGYQQPVTSLSQFDMLPAVRLETL